MNLGIDIDDVLFDTSTCIFKELSILTGRNLSVDERAVSYDISKDLGIDKDIVLQAIDSAVRVNKQVILPDVEEVLDYLCKYTKTAYLISNRKKYCPMQRTLEHVGTINTKMVFYVLYSNRYKDGRPNKAQLINFYNIELFIEDNPIVIKDVVENTKATVLIMSRPWNKDILNSDRIIRVKNWLQIKKAIDNYTEEK
jgi:uncharacterized HAD superfamily protein